MSENKCQWDECDWCGKEFEVNPGTTVYSYIHGTRGWENTFCSEQCREDHKSEPRFELTAAGQNELEARSIETKDAARYRWLRDALYRQTIFIGEARVDLDVIGCCPTTEEFDSAIDQQMESA